MDDLRAVAYGHAVSSLGYEVKMDKKQVTWKDGKHVLTWDYKKLKDGSLEISKKSRQIKRDKKGSEEDALDEHKLELIDGLLMKAMGVLRQKAEFVR